jgi:hypothetical protein
MDVHTKLAIIADPPRQAGPRRRIVGHGLHVGVSKILQEGFNGLSRLSGAQRLERDFGDHGSASPRRLTLSI